MKRPFLFPRFLALWLTLGLALPNPAFALRGMEAAQSGAEELLDKALRGTDLLSPVAAGAEEKTKIKPGEARLLIVEDDPSVRKVLMMFVMSSLQGPSASLLGQEIENGEITLENGMKVGIFSHAGRAAEWAKANRPQMVLTDLNLIGGLGFDVAAAAKAADPSAAVILLSSPVGEQQEQKIQEFLDAGNLTGFVQKPYGSSAVRALIKQHLQDRMDLAAGAEEKRTPEAGRAALFQVHPTLEQWAINQSGTIETLILGQSEPVDLKNYYTDADLGLLAKEAGYAEGLVFVVPPAKLDSAVMPAVGLRIFVEDEAGWRKTVRDNLNLQRAVDREEIRFTTNVAEANIVIAKNKIPLRPGQVFIGANNQTIGRITLGLFNELQQKGLLKPGSVVMLYSAPKDSVLIFA